MSTVKSEADMLREFLEEFGKPAPARKKGEAREDHFSRLIQHHMRHKDRHPGGREQAIAIAAREAGVARKAGGEGARGGKVIGHTRDGKPIYAKRSGGMGATQYHDVHVGDTHVGVIAHNPIAAPSRFHATTSHKERGEDTTEHISLRDAAMAIANRHTAGLAHPFRKAVARMCKAPTDAYLANGRYLAKSPTLDGDWRWDLGLLHEVTANAKRNGDAAIAIKAERLIAEMSKVLRDREPHRTPHFDGGMMVRKAYLGRSPDTTNLEPPTGEKLGIGAAKSSTAPISMLKRFPNGELDYGCASRAVVAALKSAAAGTPMGALEQALLSVLWPDAPSPSDPAAMEMLKTMTEEERAAVAAIAEAKVKEMAAWNAGRGGFVPGQSKTIE